MIVFGLISLTIVSISVLFFCLQKRGSNIFTHREFDKQLKRLDSNDPNRPHNMKLTASKDILTLEGGAEHKEEFLEAQKNIKSIDKIPEDSNFSKNSSWQNFTLRFGTLMKGSGKKRLHNLSKERPDTMQTQEKKWPELPGLGKQRVANSLDSSQPSQASTHRNTVQTVDVDVNQRGVPSVKEIELPVQKISKARNVKNVDVTQQASPIVNSVDLNRVRRMQEAAKNGDLPSPMLKKHKEVNHNSMTSADIPRDSVFSDLSV